MGLVGEMETISNGQALYQIPIFVEICHDHRGEVCLFSWKRHNLGKGKSKKVPRGNGKQ